MAPRRHLKNIVSKITILTAQAAHSRRKRLAAGGLQAEFLFKVNSQPDESL
jgi:hypothetical protein